jgi:hypothetical protein
MTLASRSGLENQSIGVLESFMLPPLSASSRSPPRKDRIARVFLLSASPVRISC